MMNAMKIELCSIEKNSYTFNLMKYYSMLFSKKSLMPKRNPRRIFTKYTYTVSLQLTKQC